METNTRIPSRKHGRKERVTVPAAACFMTSTPGTCLSMPEAANDQAFRSVLSRKRPGTLCKCQSVTSRARAVQVRRATDQSARRRLARSYRARLRAGFLRALSKRTNADKIPSSSISAFPRTSNLSSAIVCTLLSMRYFHLQCLSGCISVARQPT